MGRAIVRQPQVFLMDEPLSNLDAKLRVQTRTQIAQLQRRLGATTVYVTHDQVEAMTMGDRVAVLKDGVLQQCAAPRELYDRPANLFVAGFIGSPAMNLLELPVTDGGVQFGDMWCRSPATPSPSAGGQRDARGPARAPRDRRRRGLEIEVDVVEELGADAYVYGRTDVGGRLEQPIVARVDWRTRPSRDRRSHVAPIDDAGNPHVRPPATGLRIS